MLNHDKNTNAIWLLESTRFFACTTHSIRRICGI